MATTAIVEEEVTVTEVVTSCSDTSACPYANTTVPTVEMAGAAHQLGVGEYGAIGIAAGAILALLL